ncbi:IS66 family insertion sequence element accessory protein TnpB [Clostridium sp. YIM B02506]|uniref:IS66 family insertion sequence element accessory protein TnpA n=1 Tax=Clostridium sp. YIM B02506 TaxID=2910680 RepID=UPI001EEEB7AA|nr:IS66 family insertion sequence element accessory protein TnpB [Clostridium sp. YIM B02506]
MDKITHEMRLAQWTPIVRECRNSGRAIESWCIENNVNEKQFYYWQHRIREVAYCALEKTESKRPSNFVQLPVQAGSFSKNMSVFVADMRIHIGDNVLELSNTVSEELLSMVMRVMADVK